MQASGNWQLDRKISVGHVITTVTFLVAMIMWGARLETRIALVEETANRQTILDSRQDTDMQRMRQEIKEELERLNIKLDRYFESQFHRAGLGSRAQAE
ncbi:MAG: hypothetical protein OEW11_04220 [Nitrospirota bacterium]|nr:hypothetical protein [Nitrospirota bacterium]